MSEAKVSWARPFVGREAELAALRAALASAQQGRGRLVLLTGEPGIGKTRTAEEAARIAREQGLRVHWGRCIEGEAAPTYWPWVQVLRGCVEETEPDELEGLLREPARRIATLVPGLPGADPAPPTSEPDAARLLLFDGVATFLTRLSEKQPAVFVLDDLHWADASSLRMLEFVARAIPDHPILMIGTYREEALRDDDAAARALAGLARVSERLPLRGLDPEEVRRCIALETSSDVSQGLAEQIARASGGNPFFVGEVLRLVGRDGLEVRLPDETRHVIRRRLEPLPPQAREALEVASVIGERFGLELLEAVLDAPRTQVLDALDAGFALLEEDEQRAGSFRFGHGLVRDTLYGDLSRARRAELHARVARELEAQRGGAADPPHGEIAGHHLQSATPEGARKAVDFFIAAAERAVALLAPEQACAHYEQAIRALELAGGDPEAYCRVKLGLGEAVWRTGSDSERARREFSEAAHAAESLGEVQLEAAAALGFAAVRAETGLVDTEQIDLLERALRALGPEPSPARAQLLSRLAVAIYFAPGSVERREALSLDALAMARALGDPISLTAALYARHFTLWRPGTTDERLGLARELVALAQSAGVHEMELEGRAWQLFDLLEQGDMAAFSREQGVYERRGAGVRVPRFAWHAALLRATRAMLAGELERAEQLAQEALELGGDAEPANAAQFFALQLYHVRRDQGRAGELLPVMEDVSARFGAAMPIWRCGLAVALIEVGRLDDARRIFDELAERDFEDLPFDANWLPAMAVLAEMAAALDDVARAETLAARIAPFASQHVVIGTSVVSYGSVERHLGLLDATCGRLEEAAASLRRAREADRKLGAHALVAHVTSDLARVEAARGDADEGARLTAEAASAAQELGLATPGARLPALERSTAPRVVAAPTPQGAAPRRGLFRCEGDVWSISLGGPPLRLRDRKGLAYVATLLAAPGRERHALDLASGGEVSAEGASPGDVAAGDAGALLDETARRAYRQRVEDLEGELDEAERMGDAARVEAARGERDALENELARAFGLGGRARRAGSAAERARINVTRAIRSALRAIRDGDPELARYLETTLKTGTFCAYEPDPRFPVEWDL